MALAANLVAERMARPAPNRMPNEPAAYTAASTSGSGTAVAAAGDGGPAAEGPVKYPMLAPHASFTPLLPGVCSGRVLRCKRADAQLGDSPASTAPLKLIASSPATSNPGLPNSLSHTQT